MADVIAIGFCWQMLCQCGRWNTTVTDVMATQGHGCMLQPTAPTTGRQPSKCLVKI